MSLLQLAVYPTNCDTINLIAGDFSMAGKLGGRNKKCAQRRVFTRSLAEEEGFEPSVVLPLRLISSQVHSTTLPPLRIRFRLSKRYSIRPKTSPRRSQEPAQPAPNERWLESSPGKKISLKCLFESTIFPRARLVCACSVILQLILYPLNPQYRPPCI